MTDTTDHSDADQPAPKEANDNLPPERDKEQQALQRNNYLIKLLLLVFFCQIGVVGYFAWEMQQLSDVGDHPITANINALAELHAEVSASLKAMEDYIAFIERKQGDIEAQIFEAGEAKIAELRREHSSGAHEEALEELYTAADDLEVMMEDLTSRIDALEARPVIVETPPPPPAPAIDNTALDALKQQMDRLETSIHQGSQSHMAETLYIRRATAFSLVSQRVLSGNAYHEPLAYFLSIYGEEPPVFNSWVEILANYEEDGVPTPASLHASFTRLTNEVMFELAQQPAEEDSVWGQVKGSLSQLIVVQKTGGDPEDDSPMDRIARAEAALANGDVEEAIYELDELPEAQHALFHDWIAEAEHYLAAQEALNKIQSHFDKQLAALAASSHEDK